MGKVGCRGLSSDNMSQVGGDSSIIMPRKMSVIIERNGRGLIAGAWF